MSDYGLLMSDEYNYRNVKTESAKSKAERIEKRKEKEAEDKKIKIIKIVFFLLCFLLVTELVVYKYVMPIFSSPKVTVSGQINYSAEEIAMKLLPMNSTNWLDFDVDEAVAILSSEPGIENVVVEKSFPDKIFIDIIEREPVALTFVLEEGIICSRNSTKIENRQIYPQSFTKVSKLLIMESSNSRKLKPPPEADFSCSFIKCPCFNRKIAKIDKGVKYKIHSISGNGR